MDGSKQRAGVDYEQTFAPVANATTVRLVLALVQVNRGDVSQRHNGHGGHLTAPLEQQPGVHRQLHLLLPLVALLGLGLEELSSCGCLSFG